MSFGRIISRAVIASAAVLALCSAAANADVLYQNPDPISSSPGNVDAFTINFGFIVADTFDLSSNSTVSSVDFLAWTSSGATVTAIDWSITSGPNSGTVFGSGTGTSVSDLFQGSNSLLYDLNLDSFSVGSLNLAAGTYWLNLQNAVTTDEDRALWDQGGGTSNAWQSPTFGFLNADGGCGTSLPDTNGSCAETFRINGTAGERVPEPITFSLFGAGLIGAAAVRRRKAKAA